MKHLHLFLIFNLVVCYAGICGDTVFALAESPDAPKSCHGSAHEMAEVDESSLDIKSYSDQTSIESHCCLDYLNGSSVESSNTVFTVAQILPVLDLYSKNIDGNTLGPGLMYKGHDPPDLQTSYSTFLL